MIQAATPLSELIVATEKMLSMLHQQEPEIVAIEFEGLQQGIFTYFTRTRSKRLTAEEKADLRKINCLFDEITTAIEKRKEELGTQIKMLYAGKKMKRFYALSSR